MKSFKLLCLMALVALFSFAACNNKEKNTEQEEEIVKQLDTQSFVDIISEIYYEWNYKGDKPCIVDIYATWCAPCKMMSPILDSIAEEFKDDIYVYKVDYESSHELVDYFQIDGVPSIIYIPMNGKPIKEVGYRSKTECIDLMNKYLLNVDSTSVNEN